MGILNEKMCKYLRVKTLKEMPIWGDYRGAGYMAK